MQIVKVLAASRQLASNYTNLYSQRHIALVLKRKDTQGPNQNGIMSSFKLVKPIQVWTSSRCYRLDIPTKGEDNGKFGTVAKREETDAEKKPVKFSTSQANVDYSSTLNFHGDTQDLPPSHNAVLAFSGIFGFVYLILLRDDVDNDGGSALIKPVHETIPELAIPLIISAIAENKKFGQSTYKLEKKLKELMKEPEKYGGQALSKPKFVEN